MADAEAPDVPSHAAPRSRGRTALAVIGVVAAVLVAGAVGALAGRASVPTPEAVDASAPVMEESPQAERLPVGVASGSASGQGSGEPPTAGDAPPTVILSPALPTSWPVVLTADPGLSDTSTTGIGYRLVNAGISGAQVAGAIGAVFGATGAPIEQDGRWVVGTAGGPTVTVEDDPLVSWTFEDPTVPSTPPPTPSTPSPVPSISPAEAPITPERALELATLLLGSIGVDTTAVDWQVDVAADSTQVTAWQLVAGARTELAWRVGFDPSGAVAEASGFSAGFEQVPEYSVVGAATAVERSGQPAWTAIPPRLIAAPVAEAPAPAASPSAEPSSDLPGLTVPVIDVTVTGAELGLAQYWQPDGGLLILPAYRLAGADGSAWSILAVGDEHVAFAGQPYPTSESTTR